MNPVVQVVQVVDMVHTVYHHAEAFLFSSFLSSIQRFLQSL